MSTKSLLKTGTLSLCYGMLCSAAHSQDNSVLLDTIVIDVDTKESNKTVLQEIDGYNAAAATTATRLPAEINTTPRSINVIGQAQLEDQGAKTVEEAISYVPGVTVQTFGMDGRYDQYAIRGFDAQNSGAYRDGLPLRNYGFAGWRTEPFNAERIEVLRGPTGDLYGANEPGGLVNVVSKRPEFEFGGEMYGSLFGDIGGEVGLDVTGPINDQLAYRFVGVLNKSGTNFDEIDQSRIYIAPSFTFEPSDATSLTIYGQYQKDAVPDTYITMPYFGTARKNPLGQIDPNFYTTNPDRNRIETEQNYLGYEFDHEIMDGLTFRSRARVSRNDWLNETSYVGAFYSSSGVPNAVDTAVLLDFDVDERTDQLSFDNALQKDFQFGAVDGSIIGGIDYYAADNNYERSEQLGGFKNLSSGIISPGPNIPRQTQLISHSVKQTGIYASGVANISENWVLTGSARYDWLDIKSSFSSPIKTKNDQGFASGSMGLSYNFNNGVTIYGNMARSFNLPPNGVNVAGLPLEVEKSRSYELGARFEPFGTNSLFSIAVFDIVKLNTTQSVPTHPGAFEQIGKVRSRGLELGANYRFDNGLSLIGAYTYMDAEITENLTNQGNEFARIPRHAASLWVNYEFQTERLEGLQVGAGARYTGERYSDSANNPLYELPSNLVFDASISYEKNDWSATLSARNLLDKRKPTYCGDGTAQVVNLMGLDPIEASGCSLGAGRSVQFTLKKTF